MVWKFLIDTPSTKFTCPDAVHGFFNVSVLSLEILPYQFQDSIKWEIKALYASSMLDILRLNARYNGILFMKEGTQLPKMKVYIVVINWLCVNNLFPKNATKLIKKLYTRPLSGIQLDEPLKDARVITQQTKKCCCSVIKGVCRVADRSINLWTNCLLTSLTFYDFKNHLSFERVKWEDGKANGLVLSTKHLASKILNLTEHNIILHTYVINTMFFYRAYSQFGNKRPRMTKILRDWNQHFQIQSQAHLQTGRLHPCQWRHLKPGHLEWVKSGSDVCWTADQQKAAYTRIIPWANIAYAAYSNCWLCTVKTDSLSPCV